MRVVCTHQGLRSSSGPPQSLAWPDAASPDFAEDAQTIADTLVQDARGQSGEAHWNEDAKALIAGIILHTVIHEPPARATLATVRARPERPVLFLLDEFAAVGRLDPVKRAMGLMAGYGI